jgi:hypothetical protein
LAFIRRKGSHGRFGFYLVQNRRVEGKVRQKMLAYVGPCDAFDFSCDTIEGGIAYWERKEADCQKQANNYDAQIRELETQCGGPLPRPHRWGRTPRNTLAWKYWLAVRKTKQLRGRISRIQRRLTLLRRFQGIDVGDTQPGVA